MLHLPLQAQVIVPDLQNELELGSRSKEIFGRDQAPHFGNVAQRPFQAIRRRAFFEQISRSIGRKALMAATSAGGAGLHPIQGAVATDWFVNLLHVAQFRQPQRLLGLDTLNAHLTAQC